MSNESISRIAYSLKESSIALGGPEYYQLLGTSMLPFLKEKDKLFVNSISPSLMNLGDILVYERNKKTIVHRLVRKQKDSSGAWIIWTKGDNVSYFDEPFKEDVLIGKVNRIVRGNKEWNLNQPAHRLINMFIGFFSLVDIFAWSILKSIKKLFLPNLKLRPVIRKRFRLALASPRILLTKIYKE